MAYVPATPEERKRQGDFLTGLHNFMNTGNASDGSWRKSSKGKAKPTSTTQTPTPSAGRGSVVRVGGKEYRMNVPAEKAAYEKFQAEELKRQRNKSQFSDIRGGDGLKDDGSRFTAPTRDTAPPNPNPDTGIVQKGTLTGGSRSLTPFDMEGWMTNIGNKQGVNLRNRFASHQLPGSAEHGTALGMTAGEFEAAQSAGEVVQLKNGKWVKGSDLNNDNEGGVKTDGLNLNSTVSEVDSFYGVGNNQADNLEEGRTLTPEKINWADRTMADNSDARIRARAAFLDMDPNLGTMEAMNRARGEMGVVSHNGRYATKDSEGNTVELTKEGYNMMMSGQPLAEDFLEKYKSKVIQAATETVEEVTAGAGVAAGVDDQIIETIDGNPIEGGPISVAEFNKRFPNDNK